MGAAGDSSLERLEYPPMRLQSSRVLCSGEPLSIVYDGQPLSAVQGETVAAALTAHGILQYRQTRRGERRGLYCGMGACFECLVTIDGKANQRACLTAVAAGQQIRSRMPEGTAADPLAPLWPPPQENEPREVSLDLLVIGAGPGGLAAATAAARRGAEVMIVDERPHPGGQYFKPLAPSHHAETRIDRQFTRGRAWVQAARDAGVVILQEAHVWGAHAVDEVMAVVQGSEIVFRPRRLVIATGAYERPVPFRGWTLPGVMTSGAAQTLTRAYRVAPGRRVMIAGNGPLNLQLACELLDAGVQVVAVLDSASRPSPRQWRLLSSALRSAPDLIALGVHYLRKLRRARVRVLWNHAIVSADGGASLERVRYAPLEPSGAPNLTEAREVAADALCLGYGFIPSTEIARALGCTHRLVNRHVGYLATETARDGATSVSGVFAVGDGTDLGGHGVALARGTLAGIAVARELELLEQRRALRALKRAADFQVALWSLYRAPPVMLEAVPDDVTLCRCEDITFGQVRAEIAAGHETLARLKRAARLGMGRCQGRYCAGPAALLLAQSARAQSARAHSISAPSTNAQSTSTTAMGKDVTMYGWAPRLPVKPIPAASLAFEKPEWRGHLRTATPNLAHPADITPLSDQEAAIVIIGGGVIGACLAHEFALAGEDVLVVERDDANLQASGANAGSLHVQLLSFDFDAGGPAAASPAAATLRLGPRSISLWQELARGCSEDFEIAIQGGLMVADTTKGMNFLAAKAALERHFGVDNHILGANELRSMAPALSGRLLGAEYAPQEGKINPARATYAVLNRALAHGARFIRGANVTAITRDAGGWRIETSRCHIRAGRVVNAGGPWSRQLARLAGIDLPVHSAPLQMIVTEPAPPLLNHLVAHAGRHLSLKQAASGGLVIGGAWSAAYDVARRFIHVTRPNVEGNLWVAQQVLPQLAGLHVLRAWAAMNVDIDGAPIIGTVPGLPGFFNAVTSNGYTLAPIVARMTRDLMLHGECEYDPMPFSITRFQ
jgi:glycine/D-amino acid oxidase-like deaminating enzyme